MMTGRPTSAATARASAIVCAMPLAGTCQADLHHGRLEPLPVLGRGDGLGVGADHLGRPGAADEPLSCRAMARLRPVWPPSVGSTASGRSRSTMRSSTSGVSGST